MDEAKPDHELYDMARALVDRAGGLVNAATIAETVGLSKVRVQQLAETVTFPNPVPSAGREIVWLRDEVLAWFEDRKLRNG